MQIFITGTDTNIGKTVICSWLCLHTGHSYFKPIQTGTDFENDNITMRNIAKVNIVPSIYSFKKALSPHLAAINEQEEIDIKKINLPNVPNLIVEGAGGVLVPINKNYMMIDLIHRFNIPTIIVASTKLGTINHTMLTIEALRIRQVKILGVILNGDENNDIKNTIEFYGDVEVLAALPLLNVINRESLLNIPLSNRFKRILQAQL